MSDRTIQVSEDTYQWLCDYKRDGESFDDVVVRLRRRARWRGFGALSESGIVDGTETAHDRLEQEIRRCGERDP